MPKFEDMNNRWGATVCVGSIFGLTASAVTAPFYIAGLPFTAAHAKITGKSYIFEENFNRAMLTITYPFMWTISAFSCGEFASYEVVETLYKHGFLTNDEYNKLMR